MRLTRDIDRCFFFFSSRRRHTRLQGDWSSDVCSSDLITCAITGAGDTAGRSDKVPVTPEQIAESALGAARAGAAVVHIHVRDPKTGKGGRAPDLFRDVVQRIRASGVDVVLNLTARMGGDLVPGGDESPLPYSREGTDMAGASERLRHVEELLPQLCTLDMGTMNFAAGGGHLQKNTPTMLPALARQGQAWGGSHPRPGLCSRRLATWQERLALRIHPHA